MNICYECKKNFDEQGLKNNIDIAKIIEFFNKRIFIYLNEIGFSQKIVKTNLNNYYFNMLGFSKISFVEIYPGNRSWVLYDREKTAPNEDGVLEPSWKHKEPTFFVVTFRDYIKGFAENRSEVVESSYGYMQVEVYS